MKIVPSSYLFRLSTSTPVQPTQVQEVPQPEVAAQPEEAVQISEGIESAEARRARVENLKLQVQNNSYQEPNSEQLAQKLVMDLF